MNRDDSVDMINHAIMEMALLALLNQALRRQGIFDVEAKSLSKDYKTVCVKHTREDGQIVVGVLPAETLLDREIEDKPWTN